MKKKIIFLFKILIIYLISINISSASVDYTNLQTNLMNKIAAIKTLSFDFKQKIAEKEEIGKCIIKYPLLMKCDYQNLKQKSIISNGRTVVVIKKKYKKIYYYPIKTTLLFTILRKEVILSLVRNNKPTKVDSNLIEFEAIENGKSKFKILFDKDSLEFKGWKTKDAYSNDVSFMINNLITNKIVKDDFFKIPQESDL